jgi:hypothetical protein
MSKLHDQLPADAYDSKHLESTHSGIYSSQALF